jgi:hypothetical protein
MPDWGKIAKSIITTNPAAEESRQAAPAKKPEVKASRPEARTRKPPQTAPKAVARAISRNRESRGDYRRRTKRA